MIQQELRIKSTCLFVQIKTARREAFHKFANASVVKQVILASAKVEQHGSSIVFKVLRGSLKFFESLMVSKGQ